MNKAMLIKTAIGVVGAVALYCLHRRKQKKDPESGEPDQKRTCEAEWTAVLTENARVFNGLYSGLQRVRDGAAQKPEKVLREWCQRTHNKWENELADEICRQYIIPLIQSADREGITQWAKLLLDAAAAAGITKETTANLVLTGLTAGDYVEWDGNDLYPEDMVEIMSPAWYQNGELLEQGMCRKVDTAAQ